jgi:glyoxylase-like metal-dependent hydrolase (beta-lactamase superfamily II)
MTVRTAEIADGVHELVLGRTAAAAAVHLVRSGTSWVLIDTGWSGSGEAIREGAGSVFGSDARPAAILLTHAHPDHAGSARELARTWGVPVFMHPDELPLAGAEYLPQFANPLDRWLVGPLLRVLPQAVRARMTAAGDLTGVARGLDPGGYVPGLPDWQWVPTPGHTPGHVGYHRRRDGVLVTGDAVLTVDLNSLVGVLRGVQQVAGPPVYTTWDRSAAAASIATLAALEPRVLAPGHGRALATGVTPALRALAERLDTDRRVAPGFFRAVDYSARTRYRRPPRLYTRVQGRLGPLLTANGVGPRYVVVLEVPGRRSGVIRRTTLVRVAVGGEHFLVSLAGESEWVRNVRAAGGRAVVGRRERHAVSLVEVPPAERPAVIRAYLLRAGRRAASTAAAREAHYYFGLSSDPSAEELRRAVEHYPVFRIVEAGTAGGAVRPWS